MKTQYVPPKVLHKWILDIPGGELYELSVFDDRTVCSAVGRYAQSSGSKSCSWEEFRGGDLNDLIMRTQGQQTLTEVKYFLRELLIS